jgi:tetratricopeptide (TPR) repeat protein
MEILKNRMTNWVFFLLVVIVSVSLCYLPSLTGQFIRDDHLLIEENDYIRKTQSLSSYLEQEDGTDFLREEGHSGYYRPLINMTYAFDFKLWGLNAGRFRITNLILHLLNCLVLYTLLRRRFGNGWVPIACTLIFGIHPVNTESVSFISARNNILVCLFSLISFGFYTNRNSTWPALNRMLSVMSFALGIFSKEFAAVLIPIFLIHDRLISEKPLRPARQMARLMPFVAVLAIYFMARQWATEGFLFPAPKAGLAMRLLFAPYLIIYNLRLVFFPFGLHSFNVEYPPGMFGIETMLGLLGLALTGVLLYRFRKQKALVFPFFSFLIGLIPVLNIVPHSATSLVSMRWVYFPLAFLTLAFPILVGFLRGNILKNSVIWMALFALGGYTFYLNKFQWHDDFSLCVREVKTFHNFIYTGALAKEYHDRGNVDEARKDYLLALNLYPDKIGSYLGYAALLVDEGQPKAALAWLGKGESLKMTDQERAEFLNNKGMALFGLGENGQAIECFKEAVRADPVNGDIWANLGAAYGKSRQYRDALHVLEKGLENAPGSLKLTRNLAVTYLKMKNYEKVIETLEKVPTQERQENASIQELLRTAKERLNKSVAAR